MQRFFTIVAVASIALATGPLSALCAAPVSPATKTAVTKNAPADQYFGKLKMSPIRIRLQIDDLAEHYTKRSESDDDLLHDAGIVEESMDAWLSKYPDDVWGAPTSFHLAQLYAEIQTQAARDKAHAMYVYVNAKYGSSKESHLARLRIAQGFPDLHAETALVATPAPVAAASSPSSNAPVVSDATAAQSPASAASPAIVTSPAAIASPATAASPGPVTTAAH